MASSKKPTSKVSKKRKKGFRKKAGPIAWLFALVVAVLFLYFIFELIILDILPKIMLIGLIIILLVATFLILRFWLLKTRRPVTRVLFGILAACLAIVYGVGGIYIKDTEQMFQDVTNLADKAANVVTTYAMTQSQITVPSELDGKVVGTIASLDPEGTAGAIKQLEESGASFQTMEYENAFTLVDALYADEVDAISLPEQFHDALLEAADDINKYNALTTFTNTVDQYIYYTERSEILNNPADPVSNIMNDPFVVLISGNDSYGTLNTVSRSDVNMLVAINPKTAQVLMISIPRDTYLEVTCKKNAQACVSVAGENDKLTHTGLYGIGTTESSLEDFLSIDINYTVRVNFSSLINIVDALGGVDVEVEPGLEVETFYANGTEGVHAGVNHLDGERALAFARERYAYADGDNQRVRNQQILMKALITQIASPAMFINYPKLMKALSTAFETNMSAQQMKSLLTLEIAKRPKWNIQSYALSNEISTEYSPSLAAYSNVSIASQDQMNYAHQLIEEVLDGKVPDLSQAAQINAQSTVQTDMNADLNDPQAPAADDYGW